MDHRKAIGATIAETRRARQMTQLELGRLVGRSQPSISDVEKGKRDITVGDLVAICDALDLPLTDVATTIEAYPAAA